jgi:archaemetzincin
MISRDEGNKREFTSSVSIFLGLAYPPMSVTDIVIHPFDEIRSSLLEALRTAIAARFGASVIVSEQLMVPGSAYSSDRHQYRSTELLQQLTAHKHKDKQTRLGVTAVDLFVPALNFVFGEASRTERVAVFSVARLDPRFFGEPKDDAMLERRAITEALHELGHAFGLGHCAQQECVMWFSNTIAETDRKGSAFCPDCLRELRLSRSDR